LTTAPAVLNRANGVVVAGTVGNMVGATPMVFTVFGLFLVPIASEFDWPRSSVSFVLLIVSVAGTLSFPIIGRIIDRHGARRIMLGGIVLFAASVASVSLVEASRLQLYLAYACIGVTAAIPSNVMFTKVIAGWFDRRRGLALGIAGGVGNGLGAAISPFLAHLLIAGFGWRAGYLGLGATIALIGFPVLLALLHDPPGTRGALAPSARGSGAAPLAAEPGERQGLTLGEAAHTLPFWLVLLAIGLGAGCMTAVFAHVVPMLTDRGLAAGKATTVLATFSLVTAAWQVGVGYTLDRVPRPWIAAPFFLTAVLGLLMMESTTSYPLLLLAGALMGLGLGTEFGILPYFVSRYFGVAHYGAISGTIYAVVLLLQGIAPFLMDLVYDARGSYDLAVMVIAGGLVLGAALILRLPGFPPLARVAAAAAG